MFSLQCCGNLFCTMGKNFSLPEELIFCGNYNMPVITWELQFNNTLIKKISKENSGNFRIHCFQINSDIWKKNITPDCTVTNSYVSNAEIHKTLIIFSLFWFLVLSCDFQPATVFSGCFRPCQQQWLIFLLCTG